MNPVTHNPHTVSTLLALATRELSDLPGARLDAELLLAHAAGKRRSWVHAWPEARLDPTTRKRFLALLSRRVSGVPVAYLTGRAEFWSLELEVNASTLVPRPETETLVEAVLPHIGAETIVFDLGTGSGAIAIAIATEHPRARVIATDASAGALAVAQRNADRHNARVALVRADWLSPFAAGSADVIVSNPPYIAVDDPHLRGDGVCAEPRLALASGPAGLDAIEAIAVGAGRCLRPGGKLLVEHGFDQGIAVAALFAQAGLTPGATHKDMAGNDRVTLATKPVQDAARRTG